MSNKKAQEEIVGFVVIVVLISIVMVVFLGILIRNSSSEVSETESIELYQFLESTMEYTTSCALSYEPDFSKLGELIDECFLGSSSCTSGETPCSVLNKTLTEIIDASFFISSEGSKKGYEFRSIHSQNITQPPTEIISISKGSCTSQERSLRGSELPIFSSSGGSITSTIKLCF